MTIMLDNLIVDELKTLEPHYNIPDMSKPYSVSGNLSLLSSVTSIASNYLDNKELEEPENDFINKQLTHITI